MKRENSWLVWILVIALAVLLVGGLAVLLRPQAEEQQEQPRQFEVLLDGQALPGKETEMYFDRGREYRFEIVASEGADPSAGYVAEVISKRDEEIAFSIDGDAYRWNGITDLTEYFKPEQDAAGFTLRIPEEMTFRAVLETVYAGEALSDIPHESSLKDRLLYSMMISSPDRTTVYRIDFNVKSDETFRIGVEVPEVYRPYLDFRCRETAKFGERVEFVFFIGEGAPAWEIESVLLHDPDTGEEYALYQNLQFIFSFDMPAHDVVIVLKLTEPADP